MIRARSLGREGRKRRTSEKGGFERRPAPMLRIGIHTSIASSLASAAEKAAALGCNTFQIFSASPRMWRGSKLDPAEVRLFREAREKHDLFPLVIHDNYLINLPSADPVVRERSIEAFRAEMQRAMALGAEYLVAHPGSYRGQTPEQAIQVFAGSLAAAARGLRCDGLSVLIENTAGGGCALGSEPAELLELRRLASERVDFPIGFCIDTAHCFAAGLDFFAVLQAVGLEAVQVIHCNDSRSGFGSRLDRHEHIGKGGIGLEGFRRILSDRRLRRKAFILETPVEKPGDDRRNVRVLKALAKTR
jgi:deoxyribonuclease-4